MAVKHCSALFSTVAATAGRIAQDAYTTRCVPPFAPSVGGTATAIDNSGLVAVEGGEAVILGQSHQGCSIQGATTALFSFLDGNLECGDAMIAEGYVPW